MKKAQGISVTTIIIAALAMITLLVLILIFTGQMGKWGIGVKKIQENLCTEQNFECKEKCDPDKETPAFLKCPAGQVCCRPIASI